MGNPRGIQVELVQHTPGDTLSGIGRYTRDLYSRLAAIPHVSARLTRHADPPFTRYVSFLHHLPLGVQAHQEGTIVHFVEDLGCSQMLWHPVRPAVATSHDIGMLAWPPEAKMHRPFDRLLLYLSYLGLKQMDAVITVSEFSRRTVIQQLGVPAERVFAIYSGIDITLFRPLTDARAQLVARYGLPDGPKDKYLLYVGTEIPRKNIVTLLNAMNRLPENIRLLKVGQAGGKRFREVTTKTIAGLGLKHRVHFFEQVSEEDLIRFYNAADAYVCCSFLEGFGHPVLEAMACGTPVICSNAGSLPEIAGDAALLLAPGDDRVYAEAILAVLNDSTLRQQMTARGLRRATTFSWERTAAAVAAIYRRVVDHAVDCM